MGRITDNFKDQIRDRIRVSDVAGRHVKLKRAGREFAGLSPFTNEKTPSFFVNDEKQFWHCFSSGKHGDIFSLVMELENLTFIEAVKQLAEKAGLEMPEYTAKAKEQDDRRKLMYKAMNDAQDLYEKALYGDDGAPAREYLKSRGIGQTTAKKWGLGMAPPGYQTTPNALRHHSKDVLIESGLVKDNDRGAFGFFRNRLTIPVRDRQGRIVTFSARALDPDGKPKYLNGPETPIFSKSRTLYGADVAKNAIIKDKDALGLVLTEGCMDVIALGRAGINLGVAPLGTSITELHLEELWRYGPEPTICLDGDRAGQRAAGRVIDLALPRIRAGRTLKFAMMPAGQDPDDVLRQSGPRAVKNIIQSPISMPRMIWERERNLEPLDSPERRAGFRKRQDEHLAKIKDRETARHYKDAFFNWTRDLYRRGSQRQGKSLQGASVISHRGMGVLIRCIDNPDLFASNDEGLLMADFSPDCEKILKIAMDAFIAGMDLSREMVMDSLLADMQTNLARAVDGYPRMAPITPGSRQWDETCIAINCLREREEKPKSLADAMKAASLKKIRN